MLIRNLNTTYEIKVFIHTLLGVGITNYGDNQHLMEVQTNLFDCEELDTETYNGLFLKS